MAKQDSVSKVHLSSFDDLFQTDESREDLKRERLMEIPISLIHDFPEHPYKVRADMLSKFEIALKECSETEGWLQLLFNTKMIEDDTFKKHRNLCGRIQRMLIASCKTLKDK